MITTGYDIVESPALPSVPSFNEDIRRMVRHGMAEAVPWLRIEVGPKPGDVTHAFVDKASRTIFASASMVRRLRDATGGGND